MCFAQKIIDVLKSKKLPTQAQVKLLCNKIQEKLIECPNVIHLQSPVMVVGDIHGQFYDLLEIFEIAGHCPDTNFVFLGDYVDRGYHGIEVLLLLLSLKLLYPSRVTLLRGNHECRVITQIYGFYDECLKKYSMMIYKLFTDVFDLLPISAVVEEKVFLVHGGLSPEIKKISDINKFVRVQEIKDSGAISNLCWSDPDETIKNDWESSPRGTGFLFGKKPVDKFIYLNDVDRIIRAHQLCQEGYVHMFSNELITIFSAPNYCYNCGNTGAIFEIKENLSYHIFQFNAVDNQTGGYSNTKPPTYFL